MFNSHNIIHLLKCTSRYLLKRKIPNEDRRLVCDNRRSIKIGPFSRLAIWGGFISDSPLSSMKAAASTTATAKTASTTSKA